MDRISLTRNASHQHQRYLHKTLCEKSWKETKKRHFRRIGGEDAQYFEVTSTPRFWAISIRGTRICWCRGLIFWRSVCVFWWRGRLAPNDEENQCVDYEGEREKERKWRTQTKNHMFLTRQEAQNTFVWVVWISTYRDNAMWSDKTRKEGDRKTKPRVFKTPAKWKNRGFSVVCKQRNVYLLLGKMIMTK